jgi:hypothetical protein
MLISGSCFSQDTILIEDGSIWFSKSSCSVDFRCYDNIDEFITTNCSDTVTITSIELRENVYEKAPTIYTECRAQRLADYLRGRHNINITSIISTPILMTREEMKLAIQERNFRTIVIVLGDVKKVEL